jgi:hypothetical protein
MYKLIVFPLTFVLQSCEMWSLTLRLLDELHCFLSESETIGPQTDDVCEIFQTRVT